MQTRFCFRKPGLWDSSFAMIEKHIGAEEDRDGGSAVRILFCNIARMKYYKGIVQGVDEPKFGGAYVAQTGDAGAQYNFAPLKTDTGEFCFGMEMCIRDRLISRGLDLNDSKECRRL